MMASFNGHLDVVDTLLQHEASVDLQKKVYTIMKISFQTEVFVGRIL